MKRQKKKRKIIFAKRNIFTWLYNILKYLLGREGVLYATGTHLITAYMGGGKTLLMNKIINNVDRSKYFFLSNIKEFDGVDTFSIEDLFNDTAQQKSIPLIDKYGRRLYGIIFDEINLQFNKRLNRTKDYNNLFIGLVEFLVSSRHQGIPRVYFIGQKLELQDTQLQSLFKYQHDIIRTKRRPKYWFYYDNGYINMLPHKLIIMHRVKSQEVQDQFIDWKKQKIKCYERDFITYDTYALSRGYMALPKLEVKEAS